MARLNKEQVAAALKALENTHATAKYRAALIRALTALIPHDDNDSEGDVIALANPATRSSMLKTARAIVGVQRRAFERGAAGLMAMPDAQWQSLVDASAGDE